MEQYEKEQRRILERLRAQIQQSGYRENLGQKEARKFSDKVFAAHSAGELSYQQAAELATNLQEAVLEL